MPALLMVHSIWRWVVLIFGIAAIVKGFAGWFGRQPFGKLDHELGQWYAMSLDIQVLLGLLLWIVQGWFQQLNAAALANGQLRFFSFEHPFVMILALGIAHMGRALSRKAAYGAVRGRPVTASGPAAVAVAQPGVAAHRIAALLYLLSLALILSAIPWGGVPVH